MNVLSLNPGSSSLKFAVHVIGSAGEDRCPIRGVLERLGTSEAVLRIDGDAGEHSVKPVGNVRLSQAVKHAVDSCASVASIEAVGSRVVHGGPRFSEPTLVDDEALEAIKSLSPLAPLHNSRDVETIEGAQKVLGHLPVVAVFDTGFHRTLPPTAANYALPKDLVEAHKLRRYGFHGISYRFVSELLRAKPGSKADRLVVCHLGSGASACAILNGESIDTSMGMTPLEGLVMGTRSGDVDPGLILYLERELHIHMREIDRLLNSQSGLAGLSGLSDDVRELERAAAKGHQPSELALEVFAYRIAKYIGAYSVALEGLDMLAFCGGIGENSASVRQRICRRLSFMGVQLGDANAAPDLAGGSARVDANGQIPIWVVKTDEERQIARETVSRLS